MRRTLSLLVVSAALALPGCHGGGDSPFLRVTADSGRVYYADMRRLLHSDAGGFLAFKDLVTLEEVRLENGTYHARVCPRREVDIRQQEYIHDPSHPPVVSDYKHEKN